MPLGAVLHTPRLLLRPYRTDDGNAVHQVIRRKEIFATTYAIPRNYPRSRVDWWFAMLDNQRRNGTGCEYGVFCNRTGRYIGNCGLINIQRGQGAAEQRFFSAAISYFIDPDLWGKGYATESAAAVLDLAFGQLHMHRITGRCMSINPASRRVMEKLGMRYEGTGRDELCKDGVYYDVDHLSILQDEYFSVPSSFAHPDRG